MLEEANRVEYGELSPKQIVRQLADQGEYIGSESTNHRGERAQVSGGGTQRHSVGRH